MHEKYIIKTAITRREPRKFVQKIIRAAKLVGFTETKIQFDIIYNAVEFELRHYFCHSDKRFWWVYGNKHGFNVGGNNQTAKLRIQHENKFQQYGQYGYQYGQYNNIFNRGTTNRITDGVTSPAIVTKTTLVIFTKFKFTNIHNNYRYNTKFSGTDKRQTKYTDPRHKFIKINHETTM